MSECVLDHHYEGERQRLALMSRLLDPMHRRRIAARHAAAAREAADRYSNAIAEIVNRDGFDGTDAEHGERTWAEVLRATSSGHYSR